MALLGAACSPTRHALRHALSAKGARSSAIRVCSRTGLVAATPAVIETGNPAHEVEGIILERLRPQEIRCLDYSRTSPTRRSNYKWSRKWLWRTTQSTASCTLPSTQMAASLLDPSKPWGYKEFRQHHLASFVESIVKPAKARFEKGRVSWRLYTRAQRPNVCALARHLISALPKPASAACGHILDYKGIVCLCAGLPRFVHSPRRAMPRVLTVCAVSCRLCML